MKGWFDLSDDDKREIIIQTSNAIGLPPAAVEKDLWIVIALSAIFETTVAKHLVFKGGTSLSKAWGLIERFSEDIDLAIDRSYFGFDGELNRSQIKKLRKSSCKFISEEFKENLSEILVKQNVRDFRLNILDFERSDTDPIAIELGYKSLTESVEYLNPRILIEVSARSLRDPFEYREITSFINQKYPNSVFSHLPLSIPTVLPARTFLEKIFLLHEEFQRPEDQATNSKRMSRHLYDIAKIIDTPFVDDALLDMDLYYLIVEHRKIFTTITWVDYNLHLPQTINFIPPDRIIKLWEVDYHLMQESMFYRKTETFQIMIDRLRKLNYRINMLKR